MDKKSKLFIAFGLGAIVGAAIAALYTTEEGKALIKKVKGQVEDLSEELKSTVKKYESEITDFVRGDEPTENTHV